MDFQCRESRGFVTMALGSVGTGQKRHQNCSFSFEILVSVVVVVANEVSSSSITF